MKIIEPSYEILDPLDETAILKKLESIARVCYRSEDRITEDDSSARLLIKSIIKRGHEAMLEHASISVKFIVDRGVSHELVRHRIASWAQESTRFCNYANGKFGSELTFINPYFFNDKEHEYNAWKESMATIERNYMDMIARGVNPEEARTILPNSLKTSIVMTANIREWRKFFMLRADVPAHPQMRQITIPLLKEFSDNLPVLFMDIRQALFPF